MTVLKRRAVVPAVGGFDWFSLGSPLRSFWTEDPAWTSPGDGNDIVTWRDNGSDGVDLADRTSANPPSYHSTGANLINGRPAVAFDGGTNDEALESVASHAPNIAQPFTIAIAFQFNSVHHGYLCDGLSTTDPRILIGARAATPQWFYQAGTFQADGGADTDPHVMVCLINGASSVMRLDGAVIITGANPGSGEWDGFVMGSNQNSGARHLDGRVAGFSVWDEDITADGGFSDWEADAISHYGA